MAMVHLNNGPGMALSVARGATRTNAGGPAPRAITARRNYWSYRCVKAKSIYRTPHQHSTWYPRLLRYRTGDDCQNATSKSWSSKGTQSDGDGSKKQWSGQQKNDKPEKVWEPWSDKEFHELTEKVRSLARKDIESMRRLFAGDPYKYVFGSQANRAFNPFMSSREWTEHFWKPLFGLKYEAESPNQRPKSTEKAANNDLDPQRSQYTKHKVAYQGPDSEPAPRKQQEDEAKSNQIVQVEETYIDPISLRRVVRLVNRPAASTVEASDPAAASTQTKSSRVETASKENILTQTDLNQQEIEALYSREKKKPKLAGFAAQPWLVKEGFTKSTVSNKYMPKPPVKLASPAPKASIIDEADSKANALEAAAKKKSSHLERIQSSLDRVLATKQDTQVGKQKQNLEHAQGFKAQPSRLEQGSSIENTPLEKPKLDYTAKENRNEDIDLLRASDVRASSGRTKPRPAVVSQEANAARRQKLETDFNAIQQDLNRRLIQEFVASLASEHPQETTLLKLWASYIQTSSGRKKGKMDTARFASILQDMMTGMKLDGKALEKSHSQAHLQLGGDSSLGRYLNANRVSKALDDMTASLKGWNATIERRIGQDTKDSDILKSVFSDLNASLDSYKTEIRRQILLASPSHNRRTAKAKACDTALAKEVQQHKDAMQEYEDRPRKQNVRETRGGNLWNENLKLVHDHERQHKLQQEQNRKYRDKKLYYEVKDIYEQEYGTITTGHRQPVKEQPLSSTEPGGKVTDIATDIPDQGSPVVQEWPTSADQDTAKPVNNTKATSPASQHITSEPIMAPHVSSATGMSKNTVEGTPEASGFPNKTSSTRVSQRVVDKIDLSQLEQLHNAGLAASIDGSGKLYFHKLEAPDVKSPKTTRSPISLYSKTSVNTPEIPTQSSQIPSSQSTSTSAPSSYAQPNEPSVAPHPTASSKGSQTVRREEPVFSGQGRRSRYGSGHWHSSANQRHRGRIRTDYLNKFFAALGRMVGTGLVCMTMFYLIGMRAEWQREQRRRERESEEVNIVR